MPCRCGNHINSEKTLIETFRKASPGQCFQFFLGLPTKYDTKNVSQKECDDCRRHLIDNDIVAVCHAPYVINLARENDDTIISRSRESLEKVMDTLYRITPERTGTVVHIGAKGSIERLCRELNDMNIVVPVYMENCAGEGSKLGRNIDEMRKIIEGTDSPNVGICIDTCHAFAAGMYDFREVRQIDRMFDDLSFLDNRKLTFHMNDSLTDFGGRVDRHAPIRYGHIWNLNRPELQESLDRMYELCRDGCYDTIFETPNPVSSEFETDLFKAF